MEDNSFDPMQQQAVSTSRQKRLQMMADLLEKQSMPQQSQVVSGRVVPMGWAQGLAQFASGVGARKFQERADQEQLKAVQASQQQMATALGNYNKTREADPRGAAMSAISSPFPALQKAGLEDLKALNTAPKTPAKLATVDVHLGGGKWQTFQENADGTPNYKSPIGEAFDKKPTASSTDVKVLNTPEGKGRERVLEKMADAVSPGGKDYEKAEGAAGAIRTYGEAMQAIKDGAKGGAGAGYIQGFRKIMEQMGVADSATAPTDVLSSRLQAAVLQKLGGLGNQISDADRNFVMSAQGDITTDPKALRRMLAIDAAASMLTVEGHTKRAQYVEGETNSPGFAESVKQPWQLSIGDDQEMAGMIDNVLRGVPSTQAASAPAKAAAPAPVKPKSSAEYNKLPPGTTYIAPDGSVRRKR